MNSIWRPAAKGACLALLLLALAAAVGQAAMHRCYVCNSRGPMGDCKDPFYQNATLARLQGELEERPCPSGWCGKSMQTKESEAILQTERFCMQRPPSDGEERCALAAVGGQRGLERHMCFCKGDLCNGSATATVGYTLLLGALLLTAVRHRLG